MKPENQIIRICDLTSYTVESQKDALGAEAHKTDIILYKQKIYIMRGGITCQS